MDEMAGSLCDSPAQCVLLGSLLGGAAGAAVGELDDGEVQYVLLRVEGGRDQETVGGGHHRSRSRSRSRS